MRRAFGKFIYELAKKDQNVYLIVGDIGHGVFDDFRREFPSRFLNMGICEQSMIGVASGIALEGTITPFVYSITPFLIERAFEAVKLDVENQNANVKLVGYADYPDLGPTHALTESRPLSYCTNMCRFFPKDSQEALINLQTAYSVRGPAFVSLTEDKSLRAKVSK